MDALKASARSSRRGGQRSTGPKPGSGKRESKYTGASYAARQNAITDAMIAATQPGDTAYAKAMEKIYAITLEERRLHDAMVEAYEDGMPGKAARLAREAAECGYSIADLHANLATSLETIVVDRAACGHDRYESNRPADLPPDPFIDLGYMGEVFSGVAALQGGEDGH